MTVNERIKQRRKELKLSADDIAEKLNVDRATIYRYESADISKLPAYILEPLANALQTTPYYLMGWETSSSPQQLPPDEEEAAHLYRQLDRDDRGEIRGEMKHMLKAEKYKEKDHASTA